MAQRCYLSRCDVGVFQLCEEEIWYDHVSTKYTTQKRRAGGKSAPMVTFTEVTMKEDQFLSSPKNKQRVILMLSEELHKSHVLSCASILDIFAKEQSLVSNLKL